MKTKKQSMLAIVAALGLIATSSSIAHAAQATAQNQDNTVVSVKSFESTLQTLAADIEKTMFYPSHN